MTWTELCKKAKEMGAGIGKSRTIYFSHLEFEDDGGIYLDRAELDEDENVIPCISSDRTYEQMLAIMEAFK